MPKFKKRPVEIEAIQYVVTNAEEIHNFVGGIRMGQGFVEIHTLEGDMRAVNGDYIIKDINGEFYLCKPDMFEQTYDPIEEVVNA